MFIGELPGTRASGHHAECHQAGRCTALPSLPHGDKVRQIKKKKRNPVRQRTHLSKRPPSWGSMVSGGILHHRSEVLVITRQLQAAEAAL
jgi:hypothetical protein